MKTTYYSNGKLLLSGEYAVLDGAQAWAIPTKFGQYLDLVIDDSNLLKWRSIDDKGQVWFEGRYQKDNLREITATDTQVSHTLITLLSEAQKLNPDFLKDPGGAEIETKLTFPRDWGLGSSSTLINNIAQWAQVDAYQLLWNGFTGSGYDIACATHNRPIRYQLEHMRPIIHEVHQDIAFHESVYFVYLNKKKNSRDAITAYRQRAIDKIALVEKINTLTNQMIACDQFKNFEGLINRHESILSQALGIPTIKEELFSDYTGSIKSLGAWGGDFILATGTSDSHAYFRAKGYDTIVSFKEMAL